MKKTLMMILLSITFAVVKAQTSSPSNDETKIAAVVEQLRGAMVSGNKDSLASILSEDLTYGHSSGAIQTKDQFVKEITTKKSDFKKITITKQSVTVQDNIGIVRHILIADTNDGGKPAHIELGIVLVLRKVANDWKVMARRSFHVD
jgi:ketosteroid isomerase-like protein